MISVFPVQDPVIPFRTLQEFADSEYIPLISDGSSKLDLFKVGGRTGLLVWTACIIYSFTVIHCMDDVLLHPHQ